MRAVRSGFIQMFTYMRRDMMLFAAGLTPILAGFLFRFGIPLLENALTAWLHRPSVLSPYYALADLFFAMLAPVMFCFVSAMVALEETDDKTAAYLFVTPLGRGGYLAARFWIPAAAACLVTIVLLSAFRLTSLSIAGIVLFAAGGTLQGMIVSLMILTFSSNKLEGMAVAKLSGIVICGAAVPFFVKHKIQYVMFPMPSFWIGKAVHEKMLLSMVPAFALSAGWIFFLLRRYLRRI